VIFVVCASEKADKSDHEKSQKHLTALKQINDMILIIFKLYHLYIMNRIKQVIRKPLSDSDLKHILGDCNTIITYPDLAKYNNLDELLPSAYDFVIILLLEIATEWPLVLFN
jgi:hypothetical protein